MKFEIARLKRRCSRLTVAWLSIVWSSVRRGSIHDPAGAQSES